MQLPVLALVGYTNAGKSTLLNTLTKSNELSQDKLFATLNPATRRFNLNDTQALLTDTVGFIQKLPHSLISAFHATLEEARFSDLLIHVIDAAHPEMEKQIKSVHKVLKEIGCEEKRIVYVFNKIDLVEDKIELLNCISQYSPAIMISAKSDIGLNELKNMLAENLPRPLKHVTFKIPVGSGEVLNHLYKSGSVTEISYGSEDITGKAIIPQHIYHKYEIFLENI